MSLTQEDLEAQRQYAEDTGMDMDTVKSYTKETIDYLRYRGTSLEADKKRLAEERLKADASEIENNNALNTKNNYTTSSIKAPKPTLKVTGMPPLKTEAPEEKTNKKIEAVAQAVRELAKEDIKEADKDTTVLIEPLADLREEAPQTNNTEISTDSTPLPPATLNNKIEEKISIAEKLPYKNIETSATLPVDLKEENKVEPKLTAEQELTLREEYPFVDFDKPAKNEDDAKRLERFKQDLLVELNKKQTSIPAAESKETLVVNNLKENTDAAVSDSNSKSADSTPDNITIEQRQILREEYPFVDFDKPAKNEDDAKRFQEFEKNLFEQLKNKQSTVAADTAVVENEPTETAENNVNTAQTTSVVANNTLTTPNNSTEQSTVTTPPEIRSSQYQIPDLQQAEPAAKQPEAQIKQENQTTIEPIESPATTSLQSAITTNLGADTSEQTLKGIMNSSNSTLNVLYTMNNTLNEILKNMGSLTMLGGLEDGSGESNKASRVTTINDGSINMYRSSFRPQNNVNITQLRPTTPGFTV